jgi:hypothetical protein
MNNKKCRIWCKLVSPFLCHNTYGLSVSQRKPNVQIKYFMFDCSIYRQFVLNTGWKRDSIQMMINVTVCSTWSIVVLKTSSETWITRNDLNGVSLFHLSYLITFVAYQCSQGTPKVQTKYFNWSINRLFVLNRGWKRDSFEIMIFVNVCSTWSIVQLKRALINV